MAPKISRYSVGNGIPRRPISRAKTFDEKLPPFGDGRDLVRSSGGPGRRAWLPAFPAQHRGSAGNANGSPVPLQDRAAALADDGSVLAVGAAGTCVARLQPPRPLTPRSSPPSRGPRSPRRELRAPRSVPEARLQSDRWAIKHSFATFLLPLTPRPASIDARRAAR